MPPRNGLYHKYVVFKNQDVPDYRRPLGDVFVLRPRADAAAYAALMHYADLTQDKELADDLWGWLWDIRNAQG